MTSYTHLTHATPPQANRQVPEYVMVISVVVPRPPAARCFGTSLPTFRRRREGTDPASRGRNGRPGRDGPAGGVA